MKNAPDRVFIPCNTIWKTERTLPEDVEFIRADIAALRIAGAAAGGVVKGVLQAYGEIPASLNETCHEAPPGWSCTRAGGHEGPCAAIPVHRIQGLFSTGQNADHLNAGDMAEQYAPDASAAVASAALNKFTEKTRATKKFLPSVSFPKAEGDSKGIFGSGRGIFFKWEMKF